MNSALVGSSRSARAVAGVVPGVAPGAAPADGARWQAPRAAAQAASASVRRSDWGSPGICMREMVVRVGAGREGRGRRVECPFKSAIVTICMPK